MSTRFLDRREFTLESALAVLSAAAITIMGEACGGSSSSPTGPSGQPTPATGDKVGDISANHGHSAVITSAQLVAADAIRLNIRGTATHNHVVTLTAAEVANVANNQRVATQSSNDQGHSHTVTFS
jgi:hypothetical protein